MGYMRHHAIIVTSWKDDLLEDAHQKAVDTFPWVAPLAPNSLGVRSFFIPPDGSKEGWAESDFGDDRRYAYIKWLDAQRYEDDSTALDWVEVQYGDGDMETRIVKDSDAMQRGALKCTAKNT